MIQFVNPVWLWGLLGLSIPVGIHLLSRKEGKVIPIGSLRHLKESDTAQFSSIRLNEVLLLLLRCLLIVLLVLMLAGASIDNTTPSGEKWLVLEKGIEREDALKPLTDSLAAEGYQLRCLTKGFPLLADSGDHQPSPDYWALAQDLAARAQHEIIVLSYNYLHGFKGNRPAMPENIRWLTHEPAPATYPVKAVAIGDDSSWVRTAQTAAAETLLKTSKEKRSRAQPVENNDTISVSIFYDAPFSNDVRILEAGLRAVQTVVPYSIAIDKKVVAQYQPPSRGWVIWCSDKALPAMEASSIAYNTCAGDLQPLLIRREQANVICPSAVTSDWVITRRITEGSALEENLGIALASLLLSNKDSIAAEKDRRSMTEDVMWSATPGKESRKAAMGERSSLDVFLTMALLFSLIAERWLAFKRNQ